MTYQDFLSTSRIEKAKDLLKKNTMSITEAAFSAGYSDLRHFERIFKKITGITPSHYKTLPGEPKKQDKPH
jgi:transcriptional regulator GlxA family with amidase domain